jgi:hypothetical protein
MPLPRREGCVMGQLVLHTRWHDLLGHRGGRGHSSGGGFLHVLDAFELSGAASASRSAPAPHTTLDEVVLPAGAGP